VIAPAKVPPENYTDDIKKPSYLLKDLSVIHNILNRTTFYTRSEIFDKPQVGVQLSFPSNVESLPSSGIFS